MKSTNVQPTTKPAIVGNNFLAEVKFLLRNFIGSGEKLEFIEVDEWKIKITAGNMCSNKIKALQPLIDKHQLSWFVVKKIFTSGTEIEMHLFKPAD